MVEIATAIGLSLPPSRTIASLASAILACSFAVFLLYVRLVRRISSACGCLGTSISERNHPGLQPTLLTALILLTTAAFLVPSTTGYSGLYSQAVALGATVIFRGAQFITIRRSILYGQL